MRFASVGGILAFLVAAQASAAPPPAGAPQNTPVIVVDAAKISADHIRAMATLYKVAVLDDVKLFDAVDAIAAASLKGSVTLRSEAARTKLAAWERDRDARISKSDRRELARRATDVLQLDFEPATTDPNEQMRAFSEMVASVSASLDAFMDQNVSSNQERDSLADRTQRVAKDLARTLTLRGYGATSFAASKLADHIRDAIAILEDPSVKDAYGARGMHDLVAKTAGGSEADVARGARVADAGSRLLEALAENAGLLASPASKLELARRLGAVGAHAKVWLADKRVSPKSPTAPKGKVPALCFDDARRLVPCRVRR